MLHVHRFTFNAFQENSYVIYNETGDCCIIDPGCNSSIEEKQLIHFIQQKKLKPVYLLNTHCHLDHIFANRFIADHYGLKLHIHPEEQNVLRFGPASASMYQQQLNIYDGEILFIDEIDIIKMGDDEMNILFTPGHSPGSISFYSKADKFIISGDVLFEGSIGRTDLPGGNFEILAQSIRKKLYTLPEDVIVHPGHGDSTTIGVEMRTNPFVQVD